MTGSAAGATSDDERLLRRAFALARFARNRANGPYGALLARNGSVGAEGENTENEDDGDLTCHAEMAVLRRASRDFARHSLGEFTLYTSTEPCPMCLGAIVLAGVKRLVYGTSSARAADATGSGPTTDCRLLLRAIGSDLEVVGPLLEDESLAVFG